MKRYSTLLRSLELNPHERIQLSVIPKTPILGRGGSYPASLKRIQSAYSVPRAYIFL